MARDLEIIIEPSPPSRNRWKGFLGRGLANDDILSDGTSEEKIPTSKWNMGILNSDTLEVPGMWAC
jgi:hypothetical protein